HVETGSTCDLSAGARACPRHREMLPGAAMEPGSKTRREACVIGRVELDDVEPSALSVVSFKAGRVLIGEATAFEGLMAAAYGPEQVERAGGIGCVAIDRGAERRIVGEQVAAFERRRLVGDLVRREQRGHVDLPA